MKFLRSIPPLAGVLALMSAQVALATATLPIASPGGYVPGMAPYVASDGVNAAPVSNTNPIPVAIVSGGTGGGGGSTPTGTAGSPNAAVVTIQGIAGATPIKVDSSATTQPISAAVLPLPAGAATAAGQSTGNTALAAIQTAVQGATPAGTAHIGGVSVDDVADAATTSGSVTSAAVVVSASTAGFAGGSFQVTSAGSGCTVTYEQSNDNVNWVNLPVQGVASASGVASPTPNSVGAGAYGFTSALAYVRARASTYGSGTVSIVLVQKRSIVPFTGVSLQGSSSTIGAVTGNTNLATGYTDSSTALGAAATFTGTGRAFNSTFGPQYSFYNAQAQADQAGTLYIEVSYDSGTTHIPVQSVTATAVTNAAGTTYYVAQARAPLTGPFSSAELYRVVYKNGATAQAAFRITSSFTTG